MGMFGGCDGSTQVYSYIAPCSASDNRVPEDLTAVLENAMGGIYCATAFDPLYER
ncbi:hypothetical protein GCM10027565_23710 [Bordetella tumulicola]